MTTYHKSTGIVLAKESISESDKLIRIYTEDMGRITAISRGARRLHAKMLTATEPITETAFMFHIAAQTAIPRVIGGEIKNMFTGLKKDIKKYSLACRVAEIVDTLTAKYDTNPGTYDLLRRTMELLEKTEYPKRIYLAFVLRFMKLCGYEPRLFRCIRCNELPQGKPGNSGILFSLKEKGVICGNCAEKLNSATSILPAKSLKYIQKLSRLSGQEIANLEPDEQSDNLAVDFVETYILEFLPYPLKTQEYFNEVDAPLKTL